MSLCKGFALLLTDLAAYTISVLILVSTDRTCLKCMCTAEKHAYISMSSRLVFAWEVKIDIRLLIAFESKECLERNILSVRYQFLAAFRAVLRRQVVTWTVFTWVIELSVITLRASVMRRQRVNFGNTAHRSGKRRTYGTSGTYDVTVVIWLLNKSVRDVVHDRITVTDNGFKLSVESRLYDFIKNTLMAVHAVRSCVSNISYIGSSSSDLRRIGSVRERLDAEIDHVCDLIGVVNNDLHRLFFTKILEFLEHLISGSEIQIGLHLSIAKSHAHEHILTVTSVFLI